MKKTKTKKIPRSLKGVLKTLQAQTDLLRDYYYKAFVEKKTHYLGEIAGKLRLLVIDEGTNKALLLRLMKIFDDEILIGLSGPPRKSYTTNYRSGDKISVKEFLDLEASYNDEAKKRKKNEPMEVITKRKLIKQWSQQFGSAHQDWEIDEDFHRFLGPQFYVGGISLQGLELKTIAGVILGVCEKFLSKHKKELEGSHTVNETWNELLTVNGVSRWDDGHTKAYTFWVDDQESLRNQEATIVWFKEKDSSVFRLRNEKNIRFIFEQIYPESMIRQCSLNLDKIREEPQYHFLLKWNKNEIKLFVRYRDSTYVCSDEN